MFERWGFGRAHFGIFKDLIGPMMHPNTKEVRQKYQKTFVDEEVAPGQTQSQKESLQKVTAWTGNLGGSTGALYKQLGWNWGSYEFHMELNLPRDAKGNKKGFTS